MNFVEKLRAKAPTLGMQNFSGSPHMLEILGVAGFDCVMIDTEHTSSSSAESAHLIRAAQSFGLSPLIRVHAPYDVQIGKALDAGAEGVIVPRVNTREEASSAVSAACYPPRGTRGMCPDTRGAGYDMDSWLDYARQLPKNVAIIPLIEDKLALAEIDEICAVDGIAAVFFGPGDYGVSLGAADRGFDEAIRSETLTALDRVSQAAARAGVSMMATPLHDLLQPEEAIRLLRERGVDAVMYSIDTFLFRQLAGSIAKAFGHDTGP
jgi:2-keto-3-deoxy-L-rhamnonate aldolase RhmA